MCNGVFVAAHRRATLPVFGGISGSTSATESMRKYRPITKRNDELRMKVSSFLLRGRSASDVFVRQWKVRGVTCWFGLSLLRGFLGSAAATLLSAALLASALLASALLSTFFSCHSFYVLLLSSLVLCFFTTTRYCA
jgi:hypothetical protein